MSDVEHTAATTAVPGVPEPLQQVPSDVMQISDKMILLTWLAFGLTAFLLHKLLWKPILRAVEGVSAQSAKRWKARRVRGVNWPKSRRGVERRWRAPPPKHAR